jgi:hypothetical protein
MSQISNVLLNFILLISVSLDPKFITVGLPCGQFHGLYNRDKFETTFIIFCLLSVSPTITALRQAFDAHRLEKRLTLDN